MRSIGLIGLGAMGYPIARHLIQKGFTLYTYVRSEHSLKKAQSLGIQTVDTPAALSRHTDTILILVNNFSQCRLCLCEENGVFSTLTHGTVIISSTVDPRQIKILSEACPSGVTMMDAPISGGAVGAEDGTLVTMAAGDRQCFDSLQEVFSAYSKKIVFVGKEVGQAQALKAVNQMLVGIHMVATAESFALARGLGIDPRAMYETISECAGNSNIFRSRMPKLIAEDYSVRASLQTLEKDTGICKDLADMVQTPCYLTALCHDMFAQTPTDNASAEDACAVVRLYSEQPSD